MKILKYVLIFSHAYIAYSPLVICCTMFVATFCYCIRIRRRCCGQWTPGILLGLLILTNDETCLQLSSWIPLNTSPVFISLISSAAFFAFVTESRHLKLNMGGNRPPFKTEGQKTKLRAQSPKTIE